MRVEVTQEHIDKGRQGECDTCPIALALSYQWPNDVVAVGDRDITISNRRYLLPTKTRHWIKDFDDGRIQAPFTFEMEEIPYEEDDNARDNY